MSYSVHGPRLSRTSLGGAPAISRAYSAVLGSRCWPSSRRSSLLRVGRSFGLVLGAHNLDLDPGEQRRHGTQRGQNRSKQRERSADRHAGRQRHLQQLLVVLVADDQACDVAIRDQLLRAVYEIAGSELDVLGPGVFVFCGGAVYWSVLLAHGLSPFTLVVGFPCPPRSLLVRFSSPCRLARSLSTDDVRGRLATRIIASTLLHNRGRAQPATQGSGGVQPGLYRR